MNQNYLNLVKLYKDQNNNYTNNNNSKYNNNDYYPVTEGYAKGNMFPSLYDPYKRFVPRRLDENNPATLLASYQFAIIDLQLYLDLHPDDAKAKELFDKYLTDYKETKKLYEAQLTPLTIDCKENLGKGWKWQQNWPFEGGRR